MHRTNAIATGILLAIAVLVVASGPLGEARKNGVSGQAVAGCTCHGGGESDGSVRPALDGVPSKYEPGKKYPLKVSLSGGPPYSKAGFDLEATKKKLRFGLSPTSVATSKPICPRCASRVLANGRGWTSPPCRRATPSCGHAGWNTRPSSRRPAARARCSSTAVCWMP